MYSALDPITGARVLLPVGWYFGRDGLLHGPQEQRS